jgi:hypothetical protein
MLNFCHEISGAAMTTHVYSDTVRALCRITRLPLLVALLPLSTAHADSSIPLFSNDWLIEATIEAPFDDIMRQRSEDFEPAGTFTYLDADGKSHQLDIKVRSRGHFRADKEICDFAPLRLNFKKKQTADTEFAGQDKLKLVTHCTNIGRHHEQLILREYLAYRFLSALTDKAFGARLMRITYVDSEGESKTRTKYAFLIEDDAQVARRNNLGPANVQSLVFSQIEPAQTNLVTVFSYFIGNTDFSAIRGPKDQNCCHNVMLLNGKTGLFVPVPYDFDFSGLVDAPYASPNPRFDIRRVTTRLYRGLCRNNELLPATFALFEQHRQDIQSLVDNLEPLDGKNRKELNRYIASFYETIADKALVEREFIRECSEATGPPTET